jgi:hypothetical protein
VDASLVVFLLCLGWLAMLWILKAGLDHVESTLAADEVSSRQISGATEAPQYARPDICHEHEVVGWYLGTPIDRDISIDGVAYCFDHIQPQAAVPVAQDERCVAPGLVYVRRPESTGQE